MSTAATTSMDSDRISNLEQSIRDVRLQIKQAISVSEQGTRRTMTTLTGNVQSAKDEIALVKSEVGSRISKVETSVKQSDTRIEQNEKQIETLEKKHTKHENDVTEMKEVLNLIYQMMSTQQQNQPSPPPQAASAPPAGSMVTNSNSTITNQVISIPPLPTEIQHTSRFPRPRHHRVHRFTRNVQENTKH